MRRIMELVEGTQSFYWGSKTEFKIGTTLKGRMPKHHDSASKWVEQMFERFRPGDALSRTKSVYMVDVPSDDLIEKAGGYANHIYEVSPVGDVSKNDVTWWAEVLSLYYDSKKVAKGNDYITWCIKNIKPLVEAYYSGQFSNRPTWEYRAEACKIARKAS